MNYQNDIKHEYTYNVPTLNTGQKGTIAFMSDGTMVNISMSDYSFDGTNWDMLSYVAYVCNYINRETDGTMVAFEFFWNAPSPTPYYSIQFYTNKIDYVIFGESAIYSGLRYDSWESQDLRAPIGLQNYPSYNDRQFTEYSYLYFAGELDNQKCVYDLTSLNLDTNYYNDTFNVRGENYSFYKSVVRHSNFTRAGRYFAYGQPITEMREQARQTGYSDGYATGYVAGNDNGYQAGINSIGGNIGTQQATAFSYIGNAFGAVGNIMSLEVLPNVTLGLCFSIPMVFILIITIFKLVRK